MGDELIEGTLMGWPVSVQIMTNPGEKWVGLHLAAYTDDDDNPPPADVKRRIAELAENYETRAQAMTALKALGFKAEVA